MCDCCSEHKKPVIIPVKPKVQEKDKEEGDEAKTKD